MNLTTYKPAAFAKKIGVSVRTLNRWDKSGVFKACRTPANSRFYTQEQYKNYCIQSGMSRDSKKSADGDAK